MGEGSFGLALVGAGILLFASFPAPRAISLSLDIFHRLQRIGRPTAEDRTGSTRAEFERAEPRLQ